MAETELISRLAIMKTPPHLNQINMDCHWILSLLNLAGITSLPCESFKRPSTLENKLIGEKVVGLHRIPEDVKQNAFKTLITEKEQCVLRFMAN